MAYIDTLLTSGETVVYRTKKSWVAPLLATVPGTLLTVAGIALLTGSIFLSDIRVIGPVSRWAGLGALLVGLVLVGWSLLRWWTQEYAVTNEKVIKAEGWLRKRSEGASLEKINEIEMQQSILGRMLDFGTLNVRTASDEADLRYWMMKSPAAFRRHILEAKQRLERADAQYIAEAVHSSAAETRAHLTQGQEEATPSDILDLIQQLAALRDSGAITAAEYEAKKTDLLGRL